MADNDLLVRNARIVRPESPDTTIGDISITQGRFVSVGGQADRGARRVFDADGLVAFPGVVDVHQHWGIYNPLDADTTSESMAAAQGGVTTGLTYLRTGAYYLNRAGSYLDFMAEALRLTEGRSFVDYGFHLAPMTLDHVREIPDLVEGYGVSSFKIFMFYAGHGLHGKSNDQRSFLMLPDGEDYGLAHFERVMRGIAQLRSARPDLADSISLSLHCETAEIMAAYTQEIELREDLSGLRAYSESRPPHSEGLAIAIASYLASVTGIENINLLHLSSAEAMKTALLMRDAFPEVNFCREVTVGHLLTDIASANGIGAKVNPPIRPRSDVEALWAAVVKGDVDWVASDHACCREADKFGEDPNDVFLAKAGFGGTEYLLPGLVTEGMRRGLSIGRLAELLSANPARRYGLRSKGQISPGFDADLVLLDPESKWTVRADNSFSSQEYSPFEGTKMDVAVQDVFLRGTQIVDAGSVVGDPSGQFQSRPTEPRR